MIVASGNATLSTADKIEELRARVDAAKAAAETLASAAETPASAPAAEPLAIAPESPATEARAIALEARAIAQEAHAKAQEAHVKALEARSNALEVPVVVPKKRPVQAEPPAPVIVPEVAASGFGALAAVPEERPVRATAPDPRVHRARRARRSLVLALVLVLLGAGATMIIARNRGPDTRVANPTAAGNAVGAVDRPLPPVSEAPPTPGTAVSDSGTKGALSPVPPPVPDVVAAPESATTVVAQVGDSFWSIAEHHVATALGRAPTTAEVASYWVGLVNANQGRLLHTGNPDMIYPGQTLTLT